MKKVLFFLAVFFSVFTQAFVYKEIDYFGCDQKALNRFELAEALWTALESSGAQCLTKCSQIMDNGEFRSFGTTLTSGAAIRVKPYSLSCRVMFFSMESTNGGTLFEMLIEEYLKPKGSHVIKYVWFDSAVMKAVN